MECGVLELDFEDCGVLLGDRRRDKPFGWKHGLGQRPEGRTVCAMSKSVLSAWGMGLWGRGVGVKVWGVKVWGVKHAKELAPHELSKRLSLGHKGYWRGFW